MAVSAIVVTYRQNDLTREALVSLKRQTVTVNEIIVVDNDPERSGVALLEEHPDIRLLHEDNVGYAPGCNRGAAVATGDWLFFLNPDAEADPDCLERLLEVPREHPDAVVVTPQILFPDRARINAGENPTHLTGITWCGRYEEPPEDGPARDVLVTTGAAMLVRTDHYRQLEGYCDDFFLYYEDPDICLRTWIVGGEVWFVPRARVIHHYTWGSGSAKWFYLERHRLLSLLSTLQLRTLAVLAPLLVATEVALLAVASREGWRAEKLRAWRSVWEARGWIRERRAKLDGMRVRTDATFIHRFAARIDSSQLQTTLAERVNPLLAAYHRAAVALIRALG